MENKLTYKESLAIIAKLIEQYNLKKDRSTPELGRTIIQKLSYFLKSVGVPINYSFQIYYYGPFSQELYFHMNDLCIQEAVKDAGTDINKSNYIPGKRFKDFEKNYKKTITKFKREIDLIVDLFSGLTPQNMELLATLHYIYNVRKNPTMKDNQKSPIINEVYLIKDKKFPKKEITNFYDVMEKAGLFKWSNN